MNKILVITSSSLRHLYFAEQLNKSLNINVCKIILEGNLIKNNTYDFNNYGENIIKKHFSLRHNSEVDFFSDSACILRDKSKIINLKKNEINNLNIVKQIEKLNIDYIVSYGCSIIKGRLLNKFKKRIINVHLGISPYYTGAGTNFHCLVNNEFQFMGYSLIFMDEGVDTGEIIHQERASFFINDNPHIIGNRLIKKMTNDMIKLMSNFKLVRQKKISKTDFDIKNYKIKDATSEKTIKLYKEFELNLYNYINNRNSIDIKFPLIKQDFI